MTPVVLLTDGYIANGSAPWRIQTVEEMPAINNHILKETDDDWHPYDRDDKTLARKWALPGTAGLEHRVGGLEKDKVSGNVSYVPENHEYMIKIRAEKIKKVQDNIPLLKTEFTDEGELLVIGWGGTYGTLHSAVKQMNEMGYNNVGYAHFNYINPLPKNTEDVLQRFKKIVVCELNNGQFATVLRSQFTGLEFGQFNKMQGLPFNNAELTTKFKEMID